MEKILKNDTKDEKDNTKDEKDKMINEKDSTKDEIFQYDTNNGRDRKKMKNRQQNI